MLCPHCDTDATHVIVSYLLPWRPSQALDATRAPLVYDQHQMKGASAPHTTPTPYYCQAYAEERARQGRQD